MPERSPLLKFFDRRRARLILQAEAAECGLACMAMIASYWGHDLDMAAMRRRFEVSLKGSTLRGLIDVASGLQLQARPLQLELDGLEFLRLPCVLHWDLRHFVVLTTVKRTGVVILDPAFGERALSWAEFSKHFTGIALECQPTSAFTPVVERRSVSILALMGRVVGLGRAATQLLVMGAALEVCVLAAPLYMQWIVDDALVSGDRHLIALLGVGFLFIVTLQCAVSAARAWLTSVLSVSLNFQWLGNAFGHMMTLPLPFFEKRSLGDIVSRFASIQEIQRSLTSQFIESVIDGVMSVCVLSLMVVYEPRLAALSVCALGVYVALKSHLFVRLRAAAADRLVFEAKQQTHFFESAKGIQSVRLFGKGEVRRVGWTNALVDQYNVELRISKLTLVSKSACSFLLGVDRTLIIWLAALAVLDGRLSVGMVIAFLSYKEQFNQRASTLVDRLFEFRMLGVQGDRVADIVMTPPELDIGGEVDASRVEPSIELRQLSFRYSDQEPEILSELCLHIPAGQFVAITGASGCGKTTLLKVLLGLAEPSGGDILIGGENRKRMGVGNFRRLVGTVMQEDSLFAGTIADNICFFDAEPDRAHVAHCAVLASIHEDIERMPMKYATLVGDIGTGLSGGQKQRILLARALYKRPRILVLDEATSQLDVRNESAVNAALQKLALTRVVVAHRPETIAMAQRVLVLEGGRIARDFMQCTSTEPLQASATA